MRGGRRVVGALAAALVGCVALLAACGVTPHPTAAAKPTPPEARTCADIAGFEHAAYVAVTGVQVPSSAVGYASPRPWNLDTYALSEYRLCLPLPRTGQGSTVVAYVQSLFAEGWRAAQQFPADGKRLSACVPGTATPATATPGAAGGAAARCWSGQDGSYALVDGVGQEGTLGWFHLVVATPPIIAPPAGPATAQVCDPALYASYGDMQYIVITDGMQIPVPAGTERGQSAWGYQVTGKGYNMPFIVTPMCTAGGGSILDFMQRAMPTYGWFKGSADGLHWRIANPGGTALYLTFASLDTPAHWYIALSYQQDGPPPVMPTPTPDGPNAACVSVPGLEHAGPISLPGAQFPSEMVAAPAATVHGRSFTVVDYLACAPDFELTARPDWGSGGSPLYAMFMQGNWSYAGNFPFDGATLQGCDNTAVGNYLKQWCWAQGAARYVDIERVSEPGKGLVVFHLLYASAS